MQPLSNHTVPKSSCQKVMAEFKKNYGGVRVNNLITIGATNMINADGKLIGAKDNLAVDKHPFWSDIVLYSPGGSPRTTPVASAQTDGQLQDLVDRMNARLREDCYRFPECVDMDNGQSASCQPGYTRVGYDRGDCVSRRHDPGSAASSGMFRLRCRRATMASPSAAKQRRSQARASGVAVDWTATASVTRARCTCSGLREVACRRREARASVTEAERCFAARTTTFRTSHGIADGLDGMSGPPLFCPISYPPGLIMSG